MGEVRVAPSRWIKGTLIIMQLAFFLWMQLAFVVDATCIILTMMQTAFLLLV